MSGIHKSALLPYSAAQMFELVNQVEAYSSFLPWCKEAVVHQRTEDWVEASLHIAKGGMHKSFTTRNHLFPHHKISMELVEGPFKHLQGEWLFEPLAEEACKVSLSLDFEFHNPLVLMAMGVVFNQIANTLLDAFCQRAREVYGVRHV